MFATIITFACILALAPFSYADPPTTPPNSTPPTTPSCDDPPCKYPTPEVQPEPKFCADSFPIFGYFVYASPTEIKKVYPDAQFFGPAKLLCHRLDFLKHDDLTSAYPYPIPDDCCNEVWGSLMLLSMNDVEQFAKKSALAAFPHCPLKLVQKQIEVQKDGKTIQGNAYVVELKITPEKISPGSPVPPERLPSKNTLNKLAGYYKEAGLPQDYIDKIQNLPSAP